MTKKSAILRAAGTIGGTLALVSGVTFAQIDSNSVTLSDNTISTNLTTNSSALRISTNNSTFHKSVTGFVFSDITPGSNTGSNTETFFLKNTGSSSLTIDMAVPTLPSFTVTPSGTVDKTQVFVNVTCSGGGSNLSSDSSNDLVSLNTSGETLTGTLGAGDTVTCKTNVTMGKNAISNTNATKVTSTPFDIVFSGQSEV